MLENQVIMKSYKTIKNEYKQINIKKEYENDNYLIQTLKRTSKCKHDKKILDYENNIKDLLSYIYKEIQLQNDPKVKKIKDENDDFHKKYNSISNNFQKSTKIIFKDLINKYNQRGYKIPNLSYNHSLFKINSLIEQNHDKLEFILREDKKYKNSTSKIAMKTLAYLKKLNILLNILLSKDETIKKKISKYFITKFGSNIKNKESIDELKKSIEKLQLLIKTNNLTTNLEKKNTILIKRKSSFVSVNNYKTLKLSKPRKSKDELSNFKKKIINKTQENGSISEQFLENGDKKSDPSNNLEERLDSNKSIKSIKSIKLNKSNKSINSEKEIENIDNKISKEDTLHYTTFDVNKNLFAKTSKLIKKIKTKNLFDKEKESSTLYQINNEGCRKSYYSNTFSNYKNNHIFNSYSKKISISLKKNINNLKKLSSHKITKNLNHYFGKPKTPKEKTTFFVKTQSLEKKYKTRNNKIFLFNKKTDINSKTQENFMNTHFRTQDEYLENTYKRLKKGNYKNMEELIRKYLKEIKNLNQSQQDFIISHYNYKNLKKNLVELKEKINHNNIGKKTERLYFNNHLSKRILPLIKSMKEKELNMNRFEIIVSNSTYKYK